MRAILSEKGQVTIPKQLRDRLGLRPGEELDFEEEEGRLVARKVQQRSRVDRVWGVLPSGEGSDAFVDEVRGEVVFP